MSSGDLLQFFLAKKMFLKYLSFFDNALSAVISVLKPGTSCMKFFLIILLLFLPACGTLRTQQPGTPVGASLYQPTLQPLSGRDIATVKAMLSRLAPYIDARKKEGTQALLTFEELYQRLEPEEIRLAGFVEGLKPGELGLETPWVGYGETSIKMVPVKEAYTATSGAGVDIPRQYLPAEVAAAYRKMMEAMQEDIGRRLYLVSGYRSGAYQLYLFFLYLQNHDWSIRETARFVALPGYSEHGARQRQALDFVSAGVTTDDGTEEFDKLPEYAWLEKNAARYGFFLSYPRNSSTGVTFEPWHWHYEAKK